MRKIIFLTLLYFYLISFVSCGGNIEENTILSAKTKVSSVNIFIGDDIIYEVSIISRNDIDYRFEDISFDDRSYQSRIIEMENEIKNRGNYKERIIKYRIGFYNVGQFAVFPFKISYNYENEIREIYGEDINVMIHPFSDGETLPPMKPVLSIPMPKYVWVIAVIAALALFGIIIFVVFITKYIEKKFKEKETIKEDAEALNSLKNMNYKIYFEENRHAEYYFELTFIFKRYLTKRFRFNIEDMNTTEIKELFKENEFKGGEYIINMLEDSDYVKFAKRIPSLEIMQRDYSFCMDYVKENGNLSDALKIEEKENKNKLKKIAKIKKMQRKKEKNKLRKENIYSKEEKDKIK